MNDYRFKTSPPLHHGEIALSDARNAAEIFPHLVGRVTDVVTSPPYLDTTNYHEDQWLRLWFLGGEATVSHSRNDDRHYNAEKYQAFLTEAWTGMAPLLAEEARIVVRIGGRKLTKDELMEILRTSLKDAVKRSVQLVDTVVSSPVRHTQATAFRGSKPSPIVEHDFCFLLG